MRQRTEAFAYHSPNVPDTLVREPIGAESGGRGKRISIRWGGGEAYVNHAGWWGKAKRMKIKRGGGVVAKRTKIRRGGGVVAKRTEIRRGGGGVTPRFRRSPWAMGGEVTAPTHRPRVSIRLAPPDPIAPDHLPFN